MNNSVVDLVQLDIAQLSVGYNEIPVLSDVNLSLGNGQIGCLLGPSGCGKSTLLKAIAGFEPVLDGTIIMEGTTFSDKAFTLPPEQRGVGMVFQDLALFPHLTVAQNIAFGLRDWSTADKHVRVKRLLKLINLEGMEERYPYSLSGGQQQRVALARAMAPKPKLLLMDEPFSGLDAALRESLVPEVREILLQENMSALLVTHDQMEAFAMADKVALIHDGRIQQCDTAYNMYHRPANKFVADFIGDGEFLSGQIISEHQIQSSLGILQSEQPHGFAVNQSVEVFVRPDDLLHDDDSHVFAKVMNKQFRGSHFLYRVKLESQQELYCLASSHHNHALGESIGIKLDLDHLIIFPNND